MFKHSFRSPISIFYSIGSKPLQIWDQMVRHGEIVRLQDDDIKSNVFELTSEHVRNTFITCPAEPKQTLGIRFPFLIMIVKNLDKPFTFEVEVLDDKNFKRRFRASTFQREFKVDLFNCAMPMMLDPGWNQIHINLLDITKKVYDSNYMETSSLTIHANCRIRRVYFTDRLYSEDELPADFKIFKQGPKK